MIIVFFIELWYVYITLIIDHDGKDINLIHCYCSFEKDMPFIFIILEPDLILGRSSLQCSYFFIVNPFTGLMRETFRFGLLDCIGFCTSQRKFDSH